MKNIFKIALLTIGLVCFSGNKAEAQVVVVKPNKPKVLVVKPTKAKSGHVWVNGHWKWNGKKYVWVKGHWKKQKVGHVWVPGHWKKVKGGHQWVPGHWKHNHRTQVRKKKVAKKVYRNSRR